MNTGHWSKPLSISAIGLVSQAAVAYLVPNATTPAPSGAEPRSSGVRRRASSRAAA